MADPIKVTRVVEQTTPPMKQLPYGEDFDCNESEWKEGVSGLTTYALRNAVSLFSDVCSGEHDDVDAEEVGSWYAINSVDAESNGGGRTWNYVEAYYNAAKVGGNLVCREEDWNDFQDNSNPITINMGAQAAANAAVNPVSTFDIDVDFNTDEHTAIASMLDSIAMPSWSNRLVYYFGADIPQGFFCTVSGSNAKAYVDTVKSVLSEATHGFERTTQGWAEKVDGVLVFVSAVASEKHDMKVFDPVMNALGMVPGWDEFANVLYAGRAYREAFAAVEQIKVAAQNKADTTEACANTKALVDAAMGAVGICDDALLNPDQKEVKFVIEGALVDMLAELGNVCKPKEPPKCRNGVIEFGEECDPKAKPTGCDDDHRCNNKCECVEKGPGPGPRPPEPPEPVEARCGNGIREGTEKCDGTDLGNCKNGCTDSCRCSTQTSAA